MQHLYVPVQHALKPPCLFRNFGRAGGKCSNRQINTSKSHIHHGRQVHVQQRERSAHHSPAPARGAVCIG